MDSSTASGADTSAPDIGCEFAERTQVLRARLRGLQAISEEVQELAHRGRKYRRWSSDAHSLPPVGLKEFCNYAAQLRTAPPVCFPVSVDGWPVEPLPPGFWLPYPTVQEDFPRAEALQMVASRAPPPEVDVSLHAKVAADGASLWEIRFRHWPPAIAVLYTVDGSLPRPHAPSTFSAAAGKAVLLRPGGKMFAVAVAPGRFPSDTITVFAPRPRAAPQAPAPAVSLAAEPTVGDGPRPSLGHAAIGSGPAGMAGHEAAPARGSAAAVASSVAAVAVADQAEPARRSCEGEAPPVPSSAQAASDLLKEEPRRHVPTQSAKAKARASFRGRLLLNTDDSDEESSS